MKIGGHVSIAGGLVKSVERIVAIGGNCLQIFISSPRGWGKIEFSDEQVTRFREGIKPNNLTPVFIHGLYLANLATDKEDLRAKSIDALSHALRVGGRIGAKGVIFHPGSSGSQDRSIALNNVSKAMQEILASAEGQTELILEVSSGQGAVVGSTIEELSYIVKGVNSPRVKICLDFCHLFASGYDVTNPAVLKEMVAKFDRMIGLEKLSVIHANDSKFQLGANRDRHENIGEGFIGLEGFKLLASDKYLSAVPWILEVPGFDQKGPDQKNIEILNGLF